MNEKGVVGCMLNCRKYFQFLRKGWLLVNQGLSSKNLITVIVLINHKLLMKFPLRVTYQTSHPNLEALWLCHYDLTVCPVNCFIYICCSNALEVVTLIKKGNKSKMYQKKNDPQNYDNKLKISDVHIFKTWIVRVSF